MHVWLTTCTADKRPDDGVLPAVERYRGPRIDHARATRSPLFIFSGVYGLLAASDPVEWYDHALQPHEVDAAASALAVALQQREITAVTAILEDRTQPGWAPYHDALRAGCALAGVSFHVERFPPVSHTDERCEPHQSHG